MIISRLQKYEKRLVKGSILTNLRDFVLDPLRILDPSDSKGLGLGLKILDPWSPDPSLDL